MIKYEKGNDCVGCPQGCIHCGRENDYIYPILYCDKCECESDKLFELDEQQLCEYCVLECLDVIDAEEAMNRY